MVKSAQLYTAQEVQHILFPILGWGVEYWREFLRRSKMIPFLVAFKASDGCKQHGNSSTYSSLLDDSVELNIHLASTHPILSDPHELEIDVRLVV